MRVGDGFLAGTPTDVRVYRAALDRAGSDQPDLDGQVIETAWFQAGQGADLRATLHLEDPDRIRPAEHVVDARLVTRDRLHPPYLPEVLLHQVEGVLHSGEHSETEQVEFDQPHPCAVVLVPLQDSAVGHPGGFDRADIADRFIGQHHAAGVDAEVSGESQYLLRELHDRGGDVVGVTRDLSTPALDLFGPGVLLTLAVSERFGHIADGVLGAVGHHVGNLRSIATAVFGVDVLDDLLAAPGVEIDIDIGCFFA